MSASTGSEDMAMIERSIGGAMGNKKEPWIYPYDLSDIASGFQRSINDDASISRPSWAANHLLLHLIFYFTLVPSKAMVIVYQQRL